MLIHEICDRLCCEFVTAGTKVGLVDVNRFPRRVEEVTKEDKTSSICSMALRFPINCGHGQKPCAFCRGSAGVPVGHLLLERNKRLVTVNEYGLPEAIEFELVGAGKNLRHTKVCLIV